MSFSAVNDLSKEPLTRVNDIENRIVYAVQYSSFWNSTNLFLFFDDEQLRETQFGLAEPWSTKINYQARNDLCSRNNNGRNT